LLNAGHCNHVHYVNMPCTVNNFQINWWLFMPMMQT
jgi:hypothetical protein